MLYDPRRRATMLMIRKLLSLVVLGVVLALVTAPAFAQDDVTQFTNIVEHDLSR
jgi:hypothetical protein